MNKASNILLFGDCIATGLDVLLPEITGVPDIISDPGIISDGVDIQKSLKKQLVIWFLNQNKEKIEMKDIVRLSCKAKIKKEKELAWPAYIPNLTNLAVTGETFQGIHKKIKKYLEENKKPDFVIITDFSRSHRCIIINHDSQQYVVKRDFNFIELDQFIWPNNVYTMFMERLKQQETFGETYQKRKHKKSFNILIKLLEQNKIPHKFLIFRKYNTYLSEDFIDYSDLPKNYTNAQGKDVCSLKLQQQKSIAEHVINTILFCSTKINDNY